MEQKIVSVNGISIAVVGGGEIVINDAASAMDLMASVKYAHNCERLAVSKQAVTEDFFKLSTGVAGEILQKFVNYSWKIAIYGDFSVYTSKPLRDFIYECNQGNGIFFVDDEEAAINKLASV